MRGVVKWWRPEIGMGRLMLDSGVEAHLTRASLAPETSELADGVKVDCETIDGPSGKMAVRVRLAASAAASASPPPSPSAPPAASRSAPPTAGAPGKPPPPAAAKAGPPSIGRGPKRK